MKRIDCFIPFLNEAQAEKTIAGLKSCELVHKVYLLAGAEATGEVAGCEKISIGNLNSSEIFQIDRGTVGTCLVNVGGAATLNTKTNLDDGTYTDHVSGGRFTVSGGMLTGNIGASSVVVLYNDDSSSVSAQSATGSDSFSGESRWVISGDWTSRRSAAGLPSKMILQSGKCGCPI